MNDEVEVISPKLRGDQCEVCRDHHDITQSGIFKAMLPVQLGTLASRPREPSQLT